VPQPTTLPSTPNNSGSNSSSSSSIRLKLRLHKQRRICSKGEEKKMRKTELYEDGQRLKEQQEQEEGEVRRGQRGSSTLRGCVGRLFI
jgi:hypothetical protein